MSSITRRAVSHFTDLKDLYAEAIATPEFQAAFGDPLALSIVEPGEAVDIGAIEFGRWHS